MITQLKKAGHILKENLFTNKGAGQMILKNSFWLLLAEGTNKGILFLVTIFIARNFSVEEFGVFGFVFSIMTLIALIADFGLKNITIRELARNRSESAGFFGEALSFKILLTAIAFTLMIMASFFLERDIRLLSILAGIAILLDGLTDYLRIAFRISEHSQYEATIRAATALILIGLVICIILLKLSLLFILLGYISANLFGLLLSLRLIDQKITYAINATFVRRLMKESWPMFLGLICMTVYSQIDLILIKAYRGVAEVGLYQAAYRLLFGFQLISVVHMAMFPRLASLYAAGNTTEYRRLLRISIFLSLMALIPIGIMMTLFSKEIMGLIFGQHYVRASGAMPLLIWSGVVAFINGFFAYTLIIAGHQKMWLISVFCALASLVIIEITLIPRIGFYGAAIASFAGEVIDLVIVLIAVYSNDKLRSLFIFRH
jgi:O-antigen/teichoic acid export membrane protein